MGTDSTEPKDAITTEDVKEALTGISERTWEDADWPIISIVSKNAFATTADDPETIGQFFMQALLPSHFLTPDNIEKKLKPKEDFLFVLHSFKDKSGQDTIIKAITTRVEDFVDDPTNMIYFSHHGNPCESRGGGMYPTCNFWNFFDRDLDDDQKDIYPIPDTNFRKNFIQKNILKK